MTTNREDLELLPEMMRVAIRTMDAATCIQTDWEEGVALSDVWATIRAEVLRIAQYEEAAGRLAIEKAEQRQRAERAESELAELKRKIAEAHTGVVWAEADWHGDTGIDPPIPPEWHGQRVALLLLPLDDGGEG